MSVSNIGSAASTSASAPLTGLAALQAARAQYLRTGIDKDAAAGDPDHDATPSVKPPAAKPATQASSSSATIANAIGTLPTSQSAAAAAYGATNKR